MLPGYEAVRKGIKVTRKKEKERERDSRKDDAVSRNVYSMLLY